MTFANQWEELNERMYGTSAKYLNEEHKQRKENYHEN